MWQPIESILRRFDQWRHLRNIREALALHLRGEVRRDGLPLVRVRTSLDIRWRSRDVHPWDANASPERRKRAFREQMVADTEAAIVRLFRAVPQADRIDLEVVGPASDTVILAGTVHRSDLDTVRSPSIRMRLQQLGISFAPADDLP